MKNVARREILKGIAALPITAALGSFSPEELLAMGGGPPTAGAKGSINMNVLLHGTFAVLVDSSGVKLLPPYVKGKAPHVYQAGSWKREQALPEDCNYPVTFPGAKQMPDVNRKQNMVASASSITRNSTKPYCTIALPLPHYIFPLKSVQTFPGSGKKIFDDPTGLAQTPDQVPLVTMLRYELATNNIGWNWDFNLHIQAEPQHCPSDIHGKDAFLGLKGLFNGLDALNLNFNLDPGDLQGVKDPADARIDCSEEISLAERNDAQCGPYSSGAKTKKGRKQTKKASEASGRLAVHVTNCMSLIVMP